ncbi:hypothetical protein SCOCK_270073 [Actinacidiphila cocklensis]|uniref:Uncharacterized protein n=1 Tax=Actinacidiphila cocklensis TaxID=887465 RepID=A0A9W4E7D0_9ACTN|nr:hypothetical protein SCOCK_270073 [Actinacidiphila cocklensis]
MRFRRLRWACAAPCVGGHLRGAWGYLQAQLLGENGATSHPVGRCDKPLRVGAGPRPSATAAGGGAPGGATPPGRP